MSMESEARPDRPSTSRNEEVIEKVRQIMMEDRRLKLRKIVEEVEISRGSVHSILTIIFSTLILFTSLICLVLCFSTVKKRRFYTFFLFIPSIFIPLTCIKASKALCIYYFNYTYIFKQTKIARPASKNVSGEVIEIPRFWRCFLRCSVNKQLARFASGDAKIVLSA